MHNLSSRQHRAPRFFTRLLVASLSCASVTSAVALVPSVAHAQNLPPVPQLPPMPQLPQLAPAPGIPGLPPLAPALGIPGLPSLPAPQQAPQQPKVPFTIPHLKDGLTGRTIGTPPVQYPGAPVPEPFTMDYLGGFVSDWSPYQYGVYWEVVRLYDGLKSGRPDILQEDLEHAIAINNAAEGDAARIKRAQKDAAADVDGVMLAVSDAMGPELGKAFREAMADHRLPKTEYLLGNGYAARAGGIASSTFPEKYYFNVKRPYLRAPQAIKRYNDGKKDYYLSTPSFPSGHTNQAAWETALLAFMLPEVGPQLIFRGAESGQSRVIMGVHSPLDVIGGRMTGQAAAADRLNDPRMANALWQASMEIRAEIEWRTGKSVEQLVAEQKPYITNEEAARRYSEFMTYALPSTYTLDAPMIVPPAAPVLLAAAHPELNWEQRRQVLEQTAAPAGHPLDWQGPGGSWQRLNLVRALTATVTVNPDGGVTVN